MEFYKAAFGATELYRLDGPNGTVGHAEMKIRDAVFMLADENPEWGNKSPESLGGTPTGLLLYVEDVDADVAQALAAGATVKMPVKDQFYGDRSGSVIDPFGHHWMLATHIEDVTPDEMNRRFQEMMKGQG